MKELADILRACRERPDKVAALATVAQTEGSSYRRPGARMLVLEGGETIGSISGGCLEKDVVDHAASVRAARAAILLTYDTSSEEDIVFGAGLGCKGVVRILLEPIQPPFIGFLEHIFQSQQAGAVATVFQGNEVGHRLMLDPDGRVSHDIADPGLRDALMDAVQNALRNGRSTEIEHRDAAALVEIIHGPQPLVIFGGGYDAIPLVRIAKELGCHVTVVDARPAYADAKRFPGADAVVLARPEQAAEKIALTDRTAAVVMAHHYLTDSAVFASLRPRKLRYLGVMGPRKRAEKMAAENDLSLQGVHNPIGLDIGADSPEQIALAIMAEIQAAGAGRSGGSLREKNGPIH